jgi:hypothetical protein
MKLSLFSSSSHQSRIVSYLTHFAMSFCARPPPSSSELSESLRVIIDPRYPSSMATIAAFAGVRLEVVVLSRLDVVTGGDMVIVRGCAQAYAAHVARNMAARYGWRCEISWIKMLLFVMFQRTFKQAVSERP